MKSIAEDARFNTDEYTKVMRDRMFVTNETVAALEQALCCHIVLLAQLNPIEGSPVCSIRFCITDSAEAMFSWLR